MTGEVPIEIEVEALKRWLDLGKPITVIDVRELWERDICAIEGSESIPLGQLPARLGEVPSDRPVVVVCHHGGRSAQATSWLRHQGYDNTANLAGGIDAWARRIDPSMKVY